MERVFLVGSSRSGTTLLQSMIACHSEVVSFPETQFFDKTLPRLPALRPFKLYGKKDREIVARFLRRYHYRDLKPFRCVPDYKKYVYKPWCRKLLDIIDGMAKYHSVPKVWLEKSPRHLFYIDSLTLVDPSLKFIHMIRNGADVVASMHLASKNNQEEWEGTRSVKKCIRYWKRNINVSKQYKEDPLHFFVHYGQLLSETERVLKGICGFLSIDYEQDMATKFHQKAPDLIAEEEKPWKARNKRKKLKKSKKLHKNFDDETIDYIIKKTKPVNLQQFRND
jgi:hypothetical protein